MGFMTGDEAGQGKRLTLSLAWNCVVIYVLYEALHCRDKDVSWSHVRDHVLHELWHTKFCCTGSLDNLEQPKWCAISFTVDPALSTPITWFLWYFERRAVTFVTINYFVLPVLSCKLFLVVFKAVNEPPVPQHVQHKEHVFQALTIE